MLRCPDCGGTLSVNALELRCDAACGAVYAERDGIVCLIGSKSLLNESEVAIQDYVSDFYEDTRYARPWSRHYHESNFDQLLDLAEPRGIVLDAGCGNGAFLAFMLDGKARVDRCVGIDTSRGMLSHAQRRLRSTASATTTQLIQADACRLPFVDSCFDVVFARSLLHHLPEPAQGVYEIARVLKPGGTAVFVDPNKNVLTALPRVLARKTGRFDGDHKNFRAEELRALVGSSMRVRKLDYFGFIAYPILGFPDLVGFAEVLPLRTLAPVLMRADDVARRVPLLKRLSWGLILVAGKL